MSSSVKSIFRTLIKIPIIITIVFLVFDIFLFMVTYFRLLGFSYTVMQVAVENNYLPDSEFNQLSTFLDTIGESELVDNVHIVINDPSEDGYVDGIASARVKRQYGESVRIGVSANFLWFLPLNQKDTLDDVDSGVNGLDNNGTNGIADSSTLEQRRQDNTTSNNITITFTVPGLKYYSDLTNY